MGAHVLQYFLSEILGGRTSKITYYYDFYVRNNPSERECTRCLIFFVIMVGGADGGAGVIRYTKSGKFVDGSYVGVGSTYQNRCTWYYPYNSVVPL